MSADNNVALRHLVGLACAAANAEYAELVIGDDGILRIPVRENSGFATVEAPAEFFDSERIGRTESFDELAGSPYGSIASIPITGPSAEAGWLVAVHTDSDGIDSDAIAHLRAAASLIEDRLDRMVERIRLDQLSEALRSKQTALQDIRERLQVSNTELEQFAYIAAHELLSPLRSVVVYADLLDANLASMDQDQVHSCAVEIRNGVAQMDQQLRHLLELSSTQQDAADPIPVALDEVVREAMEGLHDQLAEAAAEVQVSVLPTVAGRPVLLRSVFSNLISNAVKYSSPEIAPVIIIRGEQDESGVRVYVEDNGPGIEPENQARVFSLFERASTTTPGSGIGLGLSRRILEAFGGSIAYQQGDTGGSVFTLTFPPTAQAA